MVTVMVFQALLDFINISAFIPLLGIIANPDFVSQFSWLPFDLALVSHKRLIFVLASGILCLAVIKHIIVALITQSKATYAYSVAHDVSVRILKEQFSKDYENFTHSSHSTEMNRMAYLPVAFANNIILALTTLISEGLIGLLIVLSIALFDYKLLLSLLLVLIPVGYSYVRGRKQINRVSDELKNRHPGLIKSVITPLEAWLEIKTSQAERFFELQFEKSQKELMKVFAAESSIQTNVARMTELFAGMIICFIIFWTLFVEVRYEQTLLLLAVYVGASFRLLPSINRILNSLVQIRSHQYVLSELQPRNDLKVSKADINAIPFQDRIVLEGISFSFSNRPSLFQNLNLEIRKGEKVAIVGKSGSGKSSLLLILLGILKATEGKIRLDSTAIAEGNRANYQCLFSYVSQNPYLFDGTIRQNVAFGLGTEKIDQERVKQALEQVDLADFVAQLPEKENTHIYEKGVTLSGGQRQRIALARAIYSNREILILDEVTNQLDQQTEAKVIESLQRITAENKTIIMVTHHPKLLPLFDLVLKLEDGKLSEVNLSASK
jgi:ABC-type bacteriocin/lantibiotic exporter with double-glycine peptidase domain